MRIIKGIFGFISLFGVMGVPGAIEFDNWIPCIAFIVIGGIGYLVIDRAYYIASEHEVDARPKYLRR